jgi:hypothetical protein
VALDGVEETVPIKVVHALHLKGGGIVEGTIGGTVHINQSSCAGPVVNDGCPRETAINENYERIQEDPGYKDVLLNPPVQEL